MPKSSKFTAEQITFALHQAEAGLPVEDLCRKLGISQATFFRWKAKYGAMGTAEMRRPVTLMDCRAALCRLHEQCGRLHEPADGSWHGRFVHLDAGISVVVQFGSVFLSNAGDLTNLFAKLYHYRHFTYTSRGEE